jgi:hypothetical protein
MFSHSVTTLSGNSLFHRSRVQLLRPPEGRGLVSAYNDNFPEAIVYFAKVILHRIVSQTKFEIPSL